MLLSPSYSVTFPLREFLAVYLASQLDAARAIGVNYYTLNSWVASGRVPLIACKALLERYDPSDATEFAQLDRFPIGRVSGAKKVSHTALTVDLSERWDLRHPALVLETSAGERLETAATVSGAISTPNPANSPSGESASPRASTRTHAQPSAAETGRSPGDALPPESEILLSLLLQVAQERDAALVAKVDLQGRTAGLEEQLLELEITIESLTSDVGKLEGDVADWMALAEERAAPPPPDRAAAVANVRAALEQKAPNLLPNLGALLGNSAGPYQ